MKRSWEGTASYNETLPRRKTSVYRWNRTKLEAMRRPNRANRTNNMSTTVRYDVTCRFDPEKPYITERTIHVF